MKLAVDTIVWRLLPRVSPGHALADSEWRTLRAAAEALLPDGVGVEPARVAQNVETFLASGRSRRAWRCRVLLHLLDVLSIARTGRRFSDLSIEKRRVFAAAELTRDDRLAWLCAKVRFLVYLGAYGDRASHASSGFVPVPARSRSRARRELAVLPRFGGELA